MVTYASRLSTLLDDLSERHGGQHGGRTDIAISDTAGVCPPAYYYRPNREDIMIDGDYFRSPPDLIAEVLMAASRSLDRGERMELYRRSGVPNLWLLEPEDETVEVYELHAQYELVGTYGVVAYLSTPLFPGEQVVVDQLFETQSKRRRDDVGELTVKEPKPIPEWLLPRKR